MPIEQILDFIEGAPKMDIFLQEVPYPANYFRPESVINNIKLIKLMERGVIGEPRASLFFTDEPKFPAFFAAPPGETVELREDQYGSSLDLTAEKAIVRAMGECVERICLRKLHKRVFGSYRSLSKKYSLADPTCFSGDKDVRDVELSWTEVFDAKNRKTIHIPSQLTYVPPNFSDFFTGEPILRLPTSNGAAYGNNYEEAIRRGLLEVVERDATMISWLSKRKLPRIELDTEKTKKLMDYFGLYNLELNVFDATTDLQIPVAITIIRDKTGIGPAISFGAGASIDLEGAVIKSILEAQQGRMWIRASYISEGKPEIKAQEIVDVKTRGLYWYKEDKAEELSFLLNTEKKSLCSLGQHNEPYSLKKIADRILGKRYDLFIADISTKDVKEVGSRVVKVICPELQPFYLNENFPAHNEKRLRGYLKEPTNKTPHPVI